MAESYSRFALVHRLLVDEALSRIGNRIPADNQWRHAMDEHIVDNASGGVPTAAGPTGHCCSRSIRDVRPHP